MSAERVRGASAVPATRVRALLSTLLIGALGLAIGVAGHSSSPAAASARGDEATSGLVITVAPAESGIVRPAGALSVRAVATNSSTEATPAGIATLAIAAGEPAGADRLAAWFGEGDTGVRPASVATAAVPALEPGSSSAIDLAVAADAVAFGGAWGPRLVEVTVQAGESVLGTARSAVVWTPDGTSPAPSTTLTVIPLTAPGFDDAFLAADDLAVLTAPGGVLVRTLEAVAGRPVAIGVDPRIIASIRALGTAAPESATAFLDRLALIPNDTFALAWADADPIATAQARGVPLPPVEGAGTAVDASVLDGGVDEQSSEDAAGSDPSPSTSAEPASPTPTPSRLAEEAPTAAELSAWPHDLDAVAWPREGSATAAALDVLEESGGETVILGRSSLDADPGLVGRTGGLRVVRADDSLSRAARDAAAATTEQEWQAAFARVSALIAASSTADASPASLIAFGRERLGNSLRLVELLGAIEALPWSRGGSLVAAIEASRPPEVGIVDAQPSEERLLEVARMLDAEAADRVFAEIALEPTSITDARRLELLAALSLGWGDESSAAAARFLTASSELRSSVQIVEGPILLLADRSSLPVTVQNGLDVPVRVFVRVDAATGQLRVEDRTVEALVEPQSQTRALVPVQSLTNGEVEITVSLIDGESRAIGSPTTVLLNLQAGWETAAVVVLAVLVVGLFAFGLARDIRRRRTRRTPPSVGRVPDGDRITS